MKNVALLVIDAQNDFTTPKGSLFVKGAVQDVDRIVAFIEKKKSDINYIALSLDSHQPIHVAHQCYWKDMNGNVPNLYTNILAQDVAQGKWIPQYNKDQALGYLEKLEENGQTCTIWPMHCILGSKGWAVDDILIEALIKWSIESGYSYEQFYKGYAQNTEHYSIFKAAVEWEGQPETSLNLSLLTKLNEYDELIIVGEAADFCVANSVADIVNYQPQLASKTIVFTDCMSWIIPNNSNAENIFKAAASVGMRFMASVDY